MQFSLFPVTLALLLPFSLSALGAVLQVRTNNSLSVNDTSYTVTPSFNVNLLRGYYKFKAEHPNAQLVHIHAVRDSPQFVPVDEPEQLTQMKLIFLTGPRTTWTIESDRNRWGQWLEPTQSAHPSHTGSAYFDPSRIRVDAHRAIGVARAQGYASKFKRIAIEPRGVGRREDNHVYYTIDFDRWRVTIDGITGRFVEAEPLGPHDVSADGDDSADGTATA